MNIPLTPTIVPIGPEVGIVWMFELVTTKLAEAESPVLPVTVITYVPGEAQQLSKLRQGSKRRKL